MLPNCTAYDLILVQGGQQQQTRRIQCSECMFRFGSHGDNNSINGDNKPNNNGPGGFSVYLLVVTEGGDALRFPIRNHTIQASACSSGGTRQGEPTTGHDASALSTLAASLRPGENTARFILVQNRKPSEAADNNNNNHSGSNGDTPTSDTDGIIVGMAPLNIFSWSIATTKLVVVDVDGTITKSTLSGFWQTAVRKDFSPDSCHDGVCQFLSTLSTQSGPHQQQQYTLSFVYLTNRPITYVEATRGLLTDLRQDSHNLPPGPLLGFTGNLAGVFKMDFYYANAHEFKYDTLERYVLRPFRQLTTSDPKCKVSNENASRPGDERKIATEVDYNMDIFYAGFGNTLFDMNAYHRAGIDLHRMFLIDKQSQIHCLDGSNSNEDKPAMNQPKTYARVRGTLFVDGYKDTKLIQHVHR